MPWHYEYTENFLTKIGSLKHRYQKQQIRDTLTGIFDLDHPKDKGAQYCRAWAYIFCGKSLLICDIIESEQRIVFSDIIV